MSVGLDMRWAGTGGAALTTATPAVGPAFVHASGNNDGVIVAGGNVRVGTSNVASFYTDPATPIGLQQDISFGIKCMTDVAQDTLVQVLFGTGQGVYAGIRWGSKAQWALHAMGPSLPSGSYAAFFDANPVPGRTYVCRLQVTPYLSRFWVDGLLVAEHLGTDGLGITSVGSVAVSMTGLAGVDDTHGWQLGRLRWTSANPRPAGRAIPSGLATVLGGEVMRLCECYKIEREDGQVFGFTTHDRDVVLGGVTYEAMSATQSTNIRQEVGGQPDNMDMSGLLSSDRITEDDLRAGAYDNAQVTVYLCDWSNPSLGSVTMMRGNIGDVTIQDNQYTASIRSLSQRFQQQVVELTSPGCRVDHLGDARCKFDLTGNTVGGSASRSTGTITSVVDEVTVHLSGIVTSVGYYSYGMLTCLTGANAGYKREIKLHSSSDSPDEVLLNPTPPGNLSYKGPLDFTASATVGFSIPAGAWDQVSLLINSTWTFVHPLTPGTDQLCIQFPSGATHDVVLRSASNNGTYNDAQDLGGDVVTAINAAAGGTFNAGLRHTAPSPTGAPFFVLHIDNVQLELVGYLAGSSDRLVLHEPFPFPVAPGDTFTVETGCNRLVSTCKSKFNNVVNFRGEPNLPGVSKLMQRGRPPS